MKARSDAEFLVHPGPETQPRIEAVRTEPHTRVAELAANASLPDALWSVLRDAGHTAATVELVSGSFSRVSYCVPMICRDGSRAATFSETREADVPARLVTGAATLGLRAGEPFAHCHAAWTDANGELRGGHLWPETSVGSDGMKAIVRALPDVRLDSAPDAETNLPVFTPRRAGDDASTGNAVLARLKPGEDLVTSAAQLCAEHGFARAQVAGIGSLVGARLEGAEGAARVVGPATEVLSLNGVVSADDEAPNPNRLICTLVDRHGAVHTGRLIPAANPVAVTYELYLEAGRPAGASA